MVLEDVSTFLFFGLIVLWWVFYNINLVRIGKYLGEDIRYVWIPLPIFYWIAYLSLAKKSMWHLLWIFLLTIPLSIGSWVIYGIYLNVKIAHRLGFSGWWGWIWFVAPFFWAPNLKVKKKARRKPKK